MANHSPPKKFTFIDLFAGIGGLRLGIENSGVNMEGHCVFTSEWNKFANQTYRENFQDSHAIAGDITQVAVDDIPDHDVLLAGFPCQPFSIAGVSKKNSLGRKHGFACNTQGTLFFDVARIIEAKRPSVFLLENVKNLQNHDKGRTFEIIQQTLKEELGYHVHTKVIDARGRVPQHRERIFIVGFAQENTFSWDEFKSVAGDSMTMKSVLHSQNGSENSQAEGLKRYIKGSKGKVDDKYILSDKLWNYLQNYAAKHKAKGNGFGYGLVNAKSIARTLSARYYKDGSEILVSRGKSNPRRLTPRECARLMGYPDSFKIPVSDTQAYKQFGNSVAVPVIQDIAQILLPHVQVSLTNKQLRYG